MIKCRHLPSKTLLSKTEFVCFSLFSRASCLLAFLFLPADILQRSGVCFFSVRIQQDPVLHGLKALNGTLRNWTVRGGKCRPWSVELVAAGWGGIWLALTVLWKELSSMPRLELSGRYRKIFLDMKLHQLQIQIPAPDLARPLPEKILFILNMDEVTRGSISMAQLGLCPLGRFILFNGLGYKTDQPAPQTSLRPWDQSTTNYPSTGPPAARRQGGPPGKQSWGTDRPWKQPQSSCQSSTLSMV